MDEATAAIKTFAARHKRELEGKTMTLAKGQVGYRVEERAKVPDEAAAIEILRGYMDDLIKTTIDKAALAKNEEALALIRGAKVVRTLVFVCKPNALGKPKEGRG